MSARARLLFVFAASEATRSNGQHRRDFGFAAVLETITAQQQLVTARRAYIQAVTQHNRAQYSLARAVALID